MAVEVSASPIRDLLDLEVSGAEAVVRILEQAGIDMVFGIPGGNTTFIFDALAAHRSAIRPVLVREESLAGVMAEVYGRLTGRPGVSIGQGAWLLTNSSLGTLEAYMSSSPMLLLGELSEGEPLSLHGPYQSGTGDYGSWDARNAFRAITKQTFAPNTPREAAYATELAIKHATTGRPGPVALLYRERALTDVIGSNGAPFLYGLAGYLPDAHPAPDPITLDRIAARLARAEFPVIIAGNGVWMGHAFDELRDLAEALGAPVATSASGKSAIAETHPQALGVYGNFGTPWANAAVACADVLLVVGSRLSPTDTANQSLSLIDPRRQVLIQIDVEPLNLGWTYPVVDGVVADARIALEGLLQRIRERHDGSTREARLAKLARIRPGAGWFDTAEMHSDASPLLPQRVIAELNAAVDDDALIACDAGENRIFMNHFWRSKAAGTFIQPAGVGGMGYALPAALAAKLVHPERQVVAVVGDGGFGMTLNALMTAVEADIPIVVVILNNHALGWVRHEQPGDHIACDFAAWDHAEIARAMRCGGWSVRSVDELRPALSAAFALHAPAVVDVHTSLEESFRRVVSPLVDPKA